MNDLCISVRSFRRPDCLKQCLDSLLRNEGIEDVDFFFFQDGAVNPFSGIRYAEDNEVEASLKVFLESELPNKTFFVSGVNLGPANRNKIQLDYLFPRYKYGVLVDNDLIFNKYYVRTLKTLFKQFKGTDVGMIQTSFRVSKDSFQDTAVKEFGDRVGHGFSHFWEMGFWRESWEKIKPYAQPYFSLVKNCDLKEFLYNKEIYQEERKKINEIYGAFRGSEATVSTSEDYALARATEMAGFKGLHTMTLRHKTIGAKGMFSFRENRYFEENHDKIVLADIGKYRRYKMIDTQDRKWITELHNRHKDQPIWIIGSDPTIEEIPEDFFDDKLNITLHLAHMRFPNADYRYANELDRVRFLKQYDPDYLDKENIFAFPFFARTENQTILATKNKGYFLHLTPCPPHGDKQRWLQNPGEGIQAMREMVVEAKNATSTYFGGFGTCLHACMYAVVMMGCNPINIVGCGLEAKDGQEHFFEGNEIDKTMRPNNHFSSPERSSLYKMATQGIIDGCRDNGIEVNWFRNFTEVEGKLNGPIIDEAKQI